ncbi:MAG: ATP-binding protein [Rhodocyclaceae bacterium]|nr:ATP-binding protein [Rhodocyclaceae bacterium]
MSLAVRLMLAGAALAAGVLTFLLATASTDPTFLSRHTLLLVGLNAGAAAVLLFLIAAQMRRLRQELKKRVFGAKLKARLLVMLVSMAVLPGVLIYAVSMRFAAKSVDAWFDARVEAALSAGLELGRGVLDDMQAELMAKARDLAYELADTTRLDGVRFDHLRARAGVAAAALLNGQGQPLLFASDDYARFLPVLPDAALLREARLSQGLARVEYDREGRLRVRAIVPLARLALSAEARYLVLERVMPESFAKNATHVEAAYRDYQEWQLGRSGMKRLYTLTLSFTLLLALFAAVALAFFLADRLARPLLMLVEGTRAVAAGDLTPREALATNDELGELTRSFNEMTKQLVKAREERDAAHRAAVWGEVARRLAHEIKNPLTPIQLSAERLQMKLMDRLDAEGQTILARATKTIIDQVEAMKNMVNDFREYARLPPPELSPLELAQLMRAVVELYQGGPIPVRLEAEEALVLADADQMRQVLHNLLKNALEASAETASRKPEVRVSLYKRDGFAHLCVRDEGHGFPAEVLARACEPYVTTKPKGTGLGLAIVKKIVADHGGRLTIANRSEGGAEVCVSLPLASPAKTA